MVGELALSLHGVVPPQEAVVGRLLFPDGLEQTIKALLWLRRTGLWWGEVVIEDCGLDADGAALANALAQRNGVVFSRDDIDCI